MEIYLQFLNKVRKENKLRYNLGHFISMIFNLEYLHDKNIIQNLLLNIFIPNII